MDRRSHNNGIETFLEHWWALLTVVLAAGAARLLGFFMGLSGLPWIVGFVASFALLFVGAGLIGYAKLPLYREGRYFTFGAKAIPVHLIGFYRWGWRVLLFGAVLGLCLVV